MRTLVCLTTAALVLLAPEAARAGKVEVPANVGVGPAANLVFGPVFDDQWAHPGLRLRIGAVIDRETIEKNLHRVNRKYRERLKNMEEVRYKPSIFIPDSLILSPPVNGTGMYGIVWRPVGIGMPIRSGPLLVRLDAGVVLTYAFLHSDRLPTTHFLRPGVELMAEAELRVTRSFYVSLGWSSLLHWPQNLGALPFDPVDPREPTLLHIGQPFLMLHYRFPVTVDI